MAKSPLYEFVGDPILMYLGTVSSAGVSASDCKNGVQNFSYQGIMLIEVTSGGDSDWAATVQFQYSSTGNASDAATSNAGMTCTDMVGTTNNSTDVTSTVKIIDVSIHEKPGVGDYSGKWFASVAAAETGGKYLGIIGIPYGGTRRYPATNAETAVNAKA